jgi:hypothetical protein
MNKLILAGFALAVLGIVLILSMPNLPSFVFFGSFFLIAALPLVIVSIVFVRLFVSIKSLFPEADNGKRITYILYFCLFLFISSGLFLFIALTSVELLIQLQCTGGECAQGGITLVFTIPLAWSSLVGVCIAERIFWSYDLIPTWKPKTWFY